ncbi:MAG: SpaA isopeptide-forming pilin-related protein, partial [Firmicutes bacterium]|nr:SpaA isopeptide-forming pilin-related protein [Bacillota bacterium]
LTKGYVLSPEQTIAVAGGKIAEMTINNKLQRGSLKVVKTFEGRTTPVEGVPFMIVGQTAMGEIRREAKTDKDGVILLENLPVGVYTVTEMRSNLTAGYVLSPAQSVTIEAGKTAEVKIENRLQKGSLRIVKTFEGLDKPLDGVPFLVVGKTVNGEVKFEVKTDKNGEILLKDLPVGTYVVTEQKSDITASYILAPAQTVTITAGSESILRITNQLAKGEIRVLKVDKETGKPLEGAMFGLYRDGKLIAEAKSGKDGYAIFKDVAFGEYEIKELSAPVGYNRSEDVLKAVVGKDGSVVMFEVTNERIPGEPVEPEEPEVPVGPDMPVPPQEPLPKTGDSKTIVVIALVVLILAGGAVLLLRKRGKDEDEAAEEEKA